MPYESHAINARGQRAAVASIGIVFFIFGFVTWLNGPLITFVKLAFDLDDVGAFLVPMAFYLSYFFLALPAAYILRATGMKKGMAVGMLCMSVGAVVFGHYTAARIYPGALSGLFVIGAGLSLLQTASNPYISVIGPLDSAAQRIALMGICNKFAGFLAPFVFGAIALRGLDDFGTRVSAATGATRSALLDAFAAQVYWPYMAMALLLALMALWLMRSPLPDIEAQRANRDERPANPGARTGEPSLFSFPHLWLGVVCLFLYVGVEVMAADAIGVYGEGFHLPLDSTRFFTSFTLFAMLAGYAAGVIIVPRLLWQQTYLAASGGLGIMLCLAAYLTQGYVSVACIAALGFANAMMWPAIFPLAIRGLGALTERGSAILIMAIAGGALMPWGYALLKTHIDFQLAYIAMAAPAYAFIAFYGLRGWRVGSER